MLYNDAPLYLILFYMLSVSLFVVKVKSKCEVEIIRIEKTFGSSHEKRLQVFEWKEPFSIDHIINKTNIQMCSDYQINGTLKSNKEYELIKLLGQGGYGSAYRAKDLKKNQMVVIKIAAVKLLIRYYNFKDGTSCCVPGTYSCVPQCSSEVIKTSKTFNSIENAALFFSSGVDGTVKIKGFGLVAVRRGKDLRKITHFITILEYLKECVVLRDFCEECKTFFMNNPNKAFEFARKVVLQLHNITNELQKIRIYQNDLKTDNILMTINSDKKSIVGAKKLCTFISNSKIAKTKINIYIIDFGNALISKIEEKVFNYSIKNKMYLYQGSVSNFIYYPPEYCPFIAENINDYPPLIPIVYPFKIKNNKINDPPRQKTMFVQVVDINTYELEVKSLLSWYIGIVTVELMASMNHDDIDGFNSFIAYPPLALFLRQVRTYVNNRMKFEKIPTTKFFRMTPYDFGLHSSVTDYLKDDTESKTQIYTNNYQQPHQQPSYLNQYNNYYRYMYNRRTKK